MPNTLAGGWTLEPMEGCDLPEQVATGFVQAARAIVGAKYVSVLYVGT